MSYQSEKLRLYSDSTMRVEREYEEVLGGRLPWPYYHSGFDEYDEEYKSVFAPYRSFGDFISRARRRSKSFIFGEICGDAQMVRESELITQGAGLTLCDTRSEEAVKRDQALGLTVFEGDVLNNSSWNLMHSYLEMTGSNGFDLIVMRPHGGWHTMGLDTNFYDYFALQYLNSCARLLNPEGGTLFFSLYNLGGEKYKNKGMKFRSWISRIAEMNTENPDYAVKISPNRRQYRVQRKSANPIILPIIGSGG